MERVQQIEHRSRSELLRAAWRVHFESRGSVVQSSVRSHVLGNAAQSRIWSGVAAASRELCASSPTGSYQAVYDKPEVKAHLESATRSLDGKTAPAAVGAAVFVGPSLAGVDCFQSTGLFARVEQTQQAEPCSRPRLHWRPVWRRPPSSQEAPRGPD